MILKKVTIIQLRYNGHSTKVISKKNIKWKSNNLSNIKEKSRVPNYSIKDVLYPMLNPLPSIKVRVS